jgi:hypothetical protein
VIVDVINTVAFLVFALALALGAGATLARVIRYRARGWHRPTLLTRDLQVIGGLALTVGSILFVRFLRTIGVDVAGLTTNLWWVLFTTIPVVWAVCVYAWFEIVIIERRPEQPYLERERPGDEPA